MMVTGPDGAPQLSAASTRQLGLRTHNIVQALQWEQDVQLASAVWSI
jgi:hypothetical protein